MADHVVITGAMGVGKTTTANSLAAELGWPQRDSDVDIEQRTGSTGRQIAQEKGVPALHELEAAVLLDALSAPGPTVISAAASVVDNASCRGAMADHAFVVVLELAPELLLERIGRGGHRRAVSDAEVRELVHRRAEVFHDVADVALDASQPTHKLVEQIITAIGDTDLAFGTQ